MSIKLLSIFHCNSRAASEAFKNSWGIMSPYKRGQLLYKLADLMDRDNEIIADVITFIKLRLKLWTVENHVQLH